VHAECPTPLAHDSGPPRARGHAADASRRRQQKKKQPRKQPSSLPESTFLFPNPTLPLGRGCAVALAELEIYFSTLMTFSPARAAKRRPGLLLQDLVDFLSDLCRVPFRILRPLRGDAVQLILRILTDFRQSLLTEFS